MKNFVLAITGPSGSGKSTVGEKVAKRLELCVNIDADHIKHMIVSGFHKDQNSPGGWTFDQWGLVGESVGLLAANFKKEGYDVVINGYLDEPAWSKIQKHIHITHKILLLPQISVVISRDAERHPDFAMGRTTVTEHHKHFSSHDFYADFERLDTSNETADEAVDAVLNLLNAS